MMYIYSQLMSNPGWIAGVVPCSEDADDHLFYGPNVLNIRVFTNIDSLGYYDSFDINHPHAQRIVKTYDTFDHYHTIVILDTATVTEDNQVEFSTLNDELKQVCTTLSKYGFEYLGEVDSTQIDVATYLDNLIKGYFDKQLAQDSDQSTS